MSGIDTEQLTGYGNTAEEIQALLAPHSLIVAAIDRLTAEVKALREVQETALRLAQGTVFREGREA